MPDTRILNIEVDRIEGAMAVCVAEDGSAGDVLTHWLPSGLRAGDHVICTFKINHAGTEAAASEAERLMERLAHRD